MMLIYCTAIVFRPFVSMALSKNDPTFPLTVSYTHPQIYKIFKKPILRLFQTCHKIL